jgi:hypothetical protein
LSATAAVQQYTGPALSKIRIPQEQYTLVVNRGVNANAVPPDAGIDQPLEKMYQLIPPGIKH